ncbi:hypothetical protein ABLG96_21040 [Nakamurella sp. A5-74]|uniref:MFS transporter n=1 Tax=Nakamurella sp. A5-74 TaxID=3158264 RepID=A0AAU8DS10_9ACTN
MLEVRNHLVVGAVLGAFFAAGVAGAQVPTAMSQRRSQWFGHGNLVVGVAMTITATVTAALPIYMAGSVVAGVGFGATFRSTIGSLAEASPEGQRGRVFATMYVVSYIAFSVPALDAGLAVSRFGLTTTTVCYGIGEIALIVVAMVASHDRKPTPTHAPADRSTGLLHE